MVTVFRDIFTFVILDYCLLNMKYIYPLFFFSFLMVSCDNDSFEPEYPVIDFSLQESTDNGALFAIDISNKGSLDLATSYGFYLKSNNEVLNTIHFQDISSMPDTYLYDIDLRKDLFYEAQMFLNFGDFKLLSNQVEFLSKGSPLPIIESLDKTLVQWNDTITLSGQRFSEIYEVYVEGISTAALVVKQDRNEIKFIVPTRTSTVTNPHILLKNQNNEIRSQQTISYKPVIVEDVSSYSIRKGDYLTIRGSEFCEVESGLTVSLKGSSRRYNLPVDRISRNEIKVLIDKEIEYRSDYQLVVSSYGKEAAALEVLKYRPAEILDAYLINDFQNDFRIQVDVKDVDLYFEAQIQVEGTDSWIQANISERGLDFVIVEFPIYNLNKLLSKNYNFKLKFTYELDSSTIDSEYTEFLNYEILSVYEHRSQLPGRRIRSGSIAHMVDGQLFSGLGKDNETNETLNDFYRYNENSDSWEKLSSFPGNATINPFIFHDDSSSIWVGAGVEGENNLVSQKVFRYDIASNTWELDSEFPESGIQSRSSGFFNGLGYVIIKRNNSEESLDILYTYNPIFKSWEEYIELPEIGYIPYFIVYQNDFYLADGFNKYPLRFNQISKRFENVNYNVPFQYAVQTKFGESELRFDNLNSFYYNYNQQTYSFSYEYINDLNSWHKGSLSWVLINGLDLFIHNNDNVEYIEHIMNR